jgi:hypothetical protein
VTHRTRESMLVHVMEFDSMDSSTQRQNSAVVASRQSVTHFEDVFTSIGLAETAFRITFLCCCFCRSDWVIQTLLSFTPVAAPVLARCMSSSQDVWLVALDCFYLRVVESQFTILVLLRFNACALRVFESQFPKAVL